MMPLNGSSGIVFESEEAAEKYLSSDVKFEQDMVAAYGDRYLKHKEELERIQRETKQQEEFNKSALNFLEVIREVHIEEVALDIKDKEASETKYANNMHNLKMGFSRHFHNRVRNYVGQHERDMQFFWIEVSKRNNVTDQLMRMRLTCELYKRALGIISNIENEITQPDIEQLDLHRDFCESKVRTLEDEIAKYDSRFLNTQYDLTKVYEMYNNLHLPMENIIRTLPMSAEASE